MNFVKQRKSVEEKGSKGAVEKSRRYQRSDSARLLLQVLSGQTSEQAPPQQLSLPSHAGDFKPEELPDGAFYRPKSELKTVLTPAPAPTQEGYGSMAIKLVEFNRPAQYIGTFSVSGSDKEARERQMELQLELMRSARDRLPVNLIITNNGVKVLHYHTNTVFMEHSLKRIWYATCDPEYCQFSFLAREPKTSAEVQYCHTFVTETAPQAEELISVIGKAFKSTDGNDNKKAPTFNEIIQQQVQEQQAKFKETEKEAHTAFQLKLKEIATPTPFSEKAQFRMEQRRQSEDIILSLCKQQVDQSVTSTSINLDKNNSNSPGNRRSEIPTRQSTPLFSSLKRNSVPTQAAMLLNPVPLSLATNPLSILAIKESIESTSLNAKFKGSPVTALKNEIDRRLSIANGESLAIPNSAGHGITNDQGNPSKQPSKCMSNRPLPLPPGVSKSPKQSGHQTTEQKLAGQSQPIQLHPYTIQQPTSALLCHSLDDNHLPRSSSSFIPLSSNIRNKACNVVLRNSPKRRPARPMSEIAISSSPASGAGSLEGQQEPLLDNFAAGIHLSSHPESGLNRMYNFSPCLQEPGNLDDCSSSNSKSHFNDRQLDTVQCLNKSEVVHSCYRQSNQLDSRHCQSNQFDSRHPQSNQLDSRHPQSNQFDSRHSQSKKIDSRHPQSHQNKKNSNISKLGQPVQSLKPENMPNKNITNVVAMKCPNDGPYQNDRLDVRSTG